ncbi:MAG: WecB/TagA/CpsF family glycosyltransferase [Alistipes sp.]|uniref:WecB/TagA/CpsF family glycosyltransferase n=1 Tax=Alistipes sp. TaxID=1872444 RepID=UPI0023F1C5B0|nr:WecB/TagA/CpsF family glycosyltransferase [Alistipes sp.]MBQ7892671.1 WecB/TagA/CpsF family glycosyltransferase [Alistipes sp.]
MKTYFNINYEFDRAKIHNSIAERLTLPGSDYICAADGVILNTANRHKQYLDIVNGGMFSICDSSYVPLYIRWIYGKRYEQYCGSQIFMDIIRSHKYRMIFMGTSQAILDGLKANLQKENPDVVQMQFVELPFRQVEEFDYPGIARIIETDGADIIWIALGAPKQEIFMSRLKPYLHHGVMIAVGAAFKFFSGTEVSRAPQWMIRCHLEFVHRIFKEPRKQLSRCTGILGSLPRLLWQEWRRKRHNTHTGH